MTAILQFFFVLFLTAAIIVAVFLYRIWRQIRDARKRFEDELRNFNPNATQYDANASRQSSNSDSPTVSDRRSPQQANKKIFGDDEGEYVEFEDEK